MPDRPSELITKRLHISGLTAALSSRDLERRLAAFGTVTALDGFGKLDALGQPRKFAYVTLEASKSQLSRCMNVLSGSTWKGAKLRIGEAKPDFRERILLENAAVDSEGTCHPRKRRRLSRGIHARHAHDMSLVTPSNAHQRPQWRVTPLGRLIRPMRMRPARPLGPPLDILKTPNPKLLSKDKERRKRRRAAAAAPPTRARRLTIDPLRWGSVHLSGVFLDGERALVSPAFAMGGEASGGNRESAEADADEEVEKILDVSQSPADDNDDSDVPPRAEPFAPPRSPSTPVDTTSADLAAEKAKALRLLYSMFDEADEDWGGAESVDSDMEQDVAAPTRANPVPHTSQGSGLHDVADFEVVPVAETVSKKSSVDRQQATQTATTTGAPRNPDSAQPTTTKLKDLFAPREEEGFSLIGHLNLDSELDLDLDLDEPAFANNGPAPAYISASNPTSTTTARPAAPTQQSKAHSLDTTLPFFFPQTSTTNSKSGGYGRNFKVNFARTEDKAQIRTRWEATRGELTREWKRRHREAVKSRRRRGGGRDGGERVE